MSRWKEAFDAHPFQATWAALKDALDKSTVDDETVITSVAELARLQKVVEYLDGLIEEVDPEIVPMTTWDSCNQQATPCLQEINNYNSNRNIAHIQNANVNIDNLLTYIRPYMVLPKAAAASIKRAATAHAKVAEQYVNSFQEESNKLLGEIKASKEQVDEYFSSIEGSKSSIDTFEEELFGEDGSSGVQSEISELVSDFTEKHESIVEYHNDTLVGDEDNPSTKKEISQAKEAILEEQEEIESLTSSVKVEVSDLEKFHIKIFGKLDKAEKKRTGGLSAELDTLKGSLNDFELKQQEKYNALVEQIEALLPGATSAGLAKAYSDMKNSFNSRIILMNILFFLAVGSLIYISTPIAIESSENFNWDYILQGIANKTLFYIPVVWVAFYATKRRSEYERLQQEYAHKESLAKSYMSYKEQIEALDGEDESMLKELITKSIATIAHNASESLDGKHGDKIPTLEMLESVVEKLVKLKGKND